MSDSTRVMSRPRHPLCRLGLRLAAVVAAAVLVLAACSSGGSPSSTGADGSPHVSGSTGFPSAVAYSACMRSHGVLNFPDPDSKGMPAPADPQQLGVSSSLLQTAEQACQHLLPTAGSLLQQTQQCLLYGDCPQALVQQLLTVERRYAQCLRRHGIPDWPDPTISAKGGRPVFDLSAAGLDSNSTAYSKDSSQFGSTDRTCRGLVGGSVPTLPYT
jgi:hypothetical protein